ncbi:MAG: hypothetical protein A3H94_07965 [Acidobacteria bacterium RIFCSPLOWO2_02_FULL_60_20]|nr:MAG: hypothetical protein A3H94_07965 [Acidobacteria bacterium RIFCSPLOWO2_02_FULL_60_20]
MGYPDWQTLASVAITLVQAERPGIDLGGLEAAMARRDFPEVFDKASTAVGLPRLLQALSGELIPLRKSKIYELIARWPIPVYLTTNFDDEIHKHLTALGVSYLPHSNSKDYMAQLVPGLTGAIVKLHGDLRSQSGLLLSKSHYFDILAGENWQYWRTRMTSVFQMVPLVIIGHSLLDPNIRHLLEAAKRGAGVVRPICWIAPDVPFATARHFLEQYRVRVISYDNRDGTHHNLIRLIESVSDFIPPRTAVPIRPEVESLSRRHPEESAAAAAIYVFNKLNVQQDFDDKRVDIVISALQSAIPLLPSPDNFDLQSALEVAGWPKGSPIDQDLAQRVCARASTQGLIELLGDRLRLGPNARNLIEDNQQQFDHMRERFLDSLRLRLKRHFPTLTDAETLEVSKDIDASLTGYFKAGGLTFATMLFATNPAPPAVPSSIAKFISEASARYPDLLKRQAFCSVSVDCFRRPEAADREYLGRLSQGFFAFHSFGAFGKVAVERLRQAKKTVWLIDSDCQIPLVALSAPANRVFLDCYARLQSAGIRLFTTEALFDETREHLWFAQMVVKEHGPASPDVIAAASGQPPYRKSNEFLQGFVQWQHNGNPCDWSAYLFEIFGRHSPTPEDMKMALHKGGVEVIPFGGWPGSKAGDTSEREEYTSSIVSLKDSLPDPEEFWSDTYKKAQPEAEVLVIVLKERRGDYYIMSEPQESSIAWFVSHTSMLNKVARERITWRPEAFLQFVFTLPATVGGGDAEDAFEALLWGFARAGISVLDERVVEAVFGGVIDQAAISIREQQVVYANTLENKYGAPLDELVHQISPKDRPLAAIQLANEMLQRQTEQLRSLEQKMKLEDKKRRKLEGELEKVEHFRKKMAAKQSRAKRKPDKKSQAKKKK